ncbi:MAG: spore coat protein H [Psychromonas sp.]|jgi:spore coat protein H|uniref:CotH kinase family protein n=1 Tax=Psychromonas sp. TaxID=1884585 RepID=UPI0039E44B50
MIFNCKPRPFSDSSIIRKFIFAGVVISSVLMITACGSGDSETEDAVDTSVDTSTDADFEISDWSDETHSKSAEPNFDEVFDNTQVKRLDLVISEAHWQSMLDDMTSLYGEFGQSTTDVNQPVVGGEPPVAGGTEAVASVEDSDNPIFVPGDVFYNDTQWYKVGLRFKGNSSLQSSWEQGILKLSFKLDFDEYEDDYPQIDNQRFYGFKKLSLKNNYDDKSFLREKVAADVFANAGLAVSHTAFYALYVDHGNGPVYFGLYTLVEEVDDTVIDTQFASDEGNLYKPEGDGASFIDGTFNETDFEKKTNEDDSDWSDIQALFSALHDDQSSPAIWRANLNAVFDVDLFLKYLAVNGVIQNWDTYGRMTHNFYLYNDPSTAKLTWIPWDNNEALQEGKMGGALALDFSNLESNDWPLIAKIMADDVYKAQYDQYLLEVISDAFEAGTMESLYDNYAALVVAYAENEVEGYTFLNGINDFNQAIAALKEHVIDRQIATDDYLYQ